MAHTIVHARCLLKNAFPCAAVEHAEVLVLTLVGNLGSAASSVARTCGLAGVSRAVASSWFVPDLGSADCQAFDASA